MAYEHYTSMPGLLSTGAMAMSVAECGKPKLPVCLNLEPFPEHEVLDFSKFSGSQVGVGCGKGRNDTLRTIQRFCHLYSPVSRM